MVQWTYWILERVGWMMIRYLTLVCFFIDSQTYIMIVNVKKCDFGKIVYLKHLYYRC